MRIISGTARGRRLVVPPGNDIRPTGDRVREAVFNALYSAGALDTPEKLVALDLFAGTGAMGLEALSRGVGRLIFVDQSASAITTVEENLANLGFADRASTARREALGWLESAAPNHVDLVFCDPPYDFEPWPRLLDLVRSQLTPGAVVVESPDGVELGGSWAEFKSGRYASTVVQIARPNGPKPEGSSEGV